MKIKITLEQLKRVLTTEKPKYPITVVMKGIDKAELEDVVKLLKKKG
ncbi:CBS domain-containing protein [Flavobacterium akiainvivens]|nr:hypothetical protein [Flavobacterium akiainvivens]SFQ45228.1 hypothetical protein SAMN05444144_1059 [Flavobacterium akiainvivens]